MQCTTCGKELAVAGMFPGAPVSCACGAKQSVTLNETPQRWSVVSAPTIPPPSSARGCPRCEAELEVRSVGGVVLAACPKSHGLFVTHAALRGVKTASVGVVAAIDDAPPSSAVDADDDSPVLCPTCSEAMSRQLAGGVHTDVCATHGTWFDAGELRAAMGARPPAKVPVNMDQAKATLDVALALEAARDEETAREGIAVAEDLLDTFNVFVLGRGSLRRRF